MGFSNIYSVKQPDDFRKEKKFGVFLNLPNLVSYKTHSDYCRRRCVWKELVPTELVSAV